MTNDDIISDVIRREGGAKFTNIEGDRGGATKYGITTPTLSAWLCYPCGAQEVASLTEGVARAIYAGRFIRFAGTQASPIGHPGFDQITDMSLRALLVDWGATSGEVPPTKALQRALQFAPSAVDGVIGPVTAGAANAGNADALYASVLAQRVAFYQKVATGNPSQEKFLAGWLDRCDEFSIKAPS
ncbi:MAG: hypothetical protein M0Z94_06595 [Dehalococcoidales bacterium]|nr:hypothetical protein [Dehalococcoidales bacterium]